MKTSNKLLIAVLALTFTGILCTSLILRATYNNIGTDLTFYGYSNEDVPPFKAIRLAGPYHGVVQVQPSDSFALRINQQKREQISWKVDQDTLILQFQRQEQERDVPPQYILAQTPNVYIMAPAVSQVQARQTFCKLTGWHVQQISVQQTGEYSYVLFTEGSLGMLSASLTQGATLHLDEKTQVAQAIITVKDSSTLIADQKQASNLDIKADPAASVRLKGALFNQLTIGETE